MRHWMTPSVWMVLTATFVSCTRTDPGLADETTDATADELWQSADPSSSPTVDLEALVGESMPGNSSHPTAGECGETLKEFVLCCMRYMACQGLATQRGVAATLCDGPYFRCALKSHTDHPSCNCGADTLEEFQWACAEMARMRVSGHSHP